jgi:rhodanese-related sulfurtransferase
MSKKHSPRFLALVESAKATVPEVTAEQVIALMETDQEIAIIDVREESEWAAGRVSGAVHLGKGVIERDIEAAIPDLNTTMVLYCGGGYRSALAAAALGAMGYARALSLSGGWRAWNEAGGSTEVP